MDAMIERRIHCKKGIRRRVDKTLHSAPLYILRIFFTFAKKSRFRGPFGPVNHFHRPKWRGNCEYSIFRLKNAVEPRNAVPESYPEVYRYTTQNVRNGTRIAEQVPEYFSEVQNSRKSWKCKKRTENTCTGAARRRAVTARRVVLARRTEKCVSAPLSVRFSL